MHRIMSNALAARAYTIDIEYFTRGITTLQYPSLRYETFLKETQARKTQTILIKLSTQMGNRICNLVATKSGILAVQD